MLLELILCCFQKILCHINYYQDKLFVDIIFIIYAWFSVNLDFNNNRIKFGVIN